MRMRSLVAATALVAASPVFAQDLALDRVGGGALGAQVSFPLHGQRSEPYVVLLDLAEQPTVIPQLGLTLAISDRFAWFSFTVPSFAGLTDANGNATASFVLPNDPTIEPCVFSLQAVAGFGPWRASNLVRVTPQLRGTFKPTLAAPPLPLAGGGAVPAADGEVLFVGGSGPIAQRYASRTEDWSLAGGTFGVGLLSQTTPLADGRVLFTGGLDLATGQPTAAAAVYDPSDGSTTTLTMASPRAGHGASRLGNGRVLVTGGFASFDLTNPLSLLQGIQATTEIYDPATDTFLPGPNMLEARTLHTSTTLTNGQVLIAGGITLLPIVNVPIVSSTAYRYDPVGGSFGLPAFFGGPRFLHSAAALDDGKVLLAGGLTLDLTTFLQTGNLGDLIVGTRTDCQLYSVGLFGFGTFTAVEGLQQGRACAAIAPLPGGRALVAGGFELIVDPTTQTFVLAPTASADVFRQGPNAITPTGAMQSPRVFPIATRLPDGTVLVAGGGAGAEIYER